MRRIQVLDSTLINQIAAGEVVERPAAVVKELLENSIDAQASYLRICLEEGGLASIVVQDDGIGMDEEDARTCFQRHATSKIFSQEDLNSISTKGFRGEAIPSMAAVSKFNLWTSTKGAPIGTRIFVEGSEELVVEAAPAIDGTRIEVAELFFNVPARKKFMKRKATELLHCQEAVYRLALAHPGIGFLLEHENKVLFSSMASSGDIRERICAALGAEVFSHLVEVEELRLGIRVSGFVALPEYNLPSARGVYTFVNRRYIRDRGINYALSRAFRDTLPAGRQPIAILFLEMDGHGVDVNVHPQKMEVRFADPRSIQEVLVSGISKAISSAPWNAHGPSPVPSELASGAQYMAAVERFLMQAQTASQDMFAREGGGAPAYVSASSAANEFSAQGFEPALNALSKSMKLLGVLAGRLWVCEGLGGTLVVVDPKAMLEHVRYAQFLELFRNQKPLEQNALLSHVVEVREEVFQKLEQGMVFLECLGFHLSIFGDRTLSVAHQWMDLSATQAKAILEEVSSHLPVDATLEDNVLPLIRALAKKAASFYLVHEATHEEARQLLKQMDNLKVVTGLSRVVLKEMALMSLLPAGERINKE
ncbi:MAG: DNA mismatch repair endonuclease MutL [Proteobacteria bacterium]|nr:DNA mismatch repair endonuclease MutL [Cystobacterineae bacterium]MCL2258634.1 DNA mismatch repair endonuclease MutL [Cystobacterineae bacterium]MCL2314951.1 DNA mismatch repair endonuclease MutL [Pseudomonadota bacterium]